MAIYVIFLMHDINMFGYFQAHVVKLKPLRP